ncbi:hypothetical protein CDAR_35671 [Caerostris darwini]|uniref:Uncharacterized protein n=1 Tax=Caerostris darwini TaxID=1538125 RepID=A0AAV4VC34_9ARAC|nr:hypothetical protein CDAR_35671 [Caerostris darwini]
MRGRYSGFEESMVERHVSILNRPILCSEIGLCYNFLIIAVGFSPICHSGENTLDDAFASRNSKIPPLTGKSLYNSHFPGSVRHRGLPDESPRNQSGQNSLFGHKKHRERETQCVNDIFETGPTKRSAKTSSGEGGTIKSGGGKGRAQLNSRLTKWGEGTILFERAHQRIRGP